MENNTAKSQAKAQYDSISEMLERLHHAQECGGIWDGEECTLDDDYHDTDDAQQAIYDDPLSVEVRSDWEAPGTDLTPSEFCILLYTGGPAVRIIGELDQFGQPDRAWMEYQDWGTPWTHYFEAESSVLLDYAQNFYYGG